MKKIILTTSLVALVASSSFAQGLLAFKTSATKNPAAYSTDGTTASLLGVATDGTAGSFGAVSYIVYSAPTGTAANTITIVPSGIGSTLVFSGAWTANPVTLTNGYTGVGVLGQNNVTTSANSGSAGGAIDVEIVAYTGTLANPTSYAYSGEVFNGGTTFALGLGSGLSTGALDFQTATGNPGGSPASPGAFATGSTAFGALVLEPVGAPEPTSLAIGGLAAAALLAFRRRK